MKASFLTTLMTGAAMLAATSVSAQKILDASKFSDKKKARMNSVTMCLYGVHPEGTHYQSLQMQNLYADFAKYHRNTAYLPIGNGKDPLTDSTLKATAALLPKFKHAEHVNIILDFTGGIKTETRNDTIYTTSRAYLNDPSDMTKAILADSVFAALAAGLYPAAQEKDKKAAKKPKQVNLMILSRTGVADLEAIGSTMPPGTWGIILNPDANPLEPDSDIRNRHDYALPPYMIKPSGFLEKQVQRCQESEKPKPLPENRNVYAFYVSDEPGEEFGDFKTEHRVYVIDLRKQMKNYKHDMKTMDRDNSGFMDPVVRIGLENELKKDPPKGEQREAYLELAGMSFWLEALRQNNQYCAFAETAGMVYKKQLTAPTLSRYQALKNN